MKTKRQFFICNKVFINWQELLDYGVEHLAQDPCGYGTQWAMTLVNDCRYMISKTYKKEGKEKTAIDFKTDYLAEIAIGVKSNYDPASL